ncbi:MAG: hypothetical protein EA423_02170 [Phycisphaerales bacterium]|nr:MAG: hypothetical protein EA423_02170 [Phycisphaerales bacterium]
MTPGTQDAAPLRRDMLVQPRDLRLPIGFDSVYRDRNQSGVYYRIGGGITARFPRSVYYSTPFGTITDIPPGTVFLIGPPPGSEDPFAYKPPSFEGRTGGLETGPSRVDPRLRSSLAPGARGQPFSMLGRAGPSASREAQHAHPLLARGQDAEPDTDNPIFAGELSRSVRLGELLGRAPRRGDSAPGADQ